MTNEDAMTFESAARENSGDDGWRYHFVGLCRGPHLAPPSREARLLGLELGELLMEPRDLVARALKLNLEAGQGSSWDGEKRSPQDKMSLELSAPPVPHLCFSQAREILLALALQLGYAEPALSIHFLTNLLLRPGEQRATAAGRPAQKICPGCRKVARKNLRSAFAELPVGSSGGCCADRKRAASQRKLLRSPHRGQCSHNEDTPWFLSARAASRVLPGLLMGVGSSKEEAAPSSSRTFRHAGREGRCSLSRGGGWRCAQRPGLPAGLPPGGVAGAPPPPAPCLRASAEEKMPAAPQDERRAASAGSATPTSHRQIRPRHSPFARSQKETRPPPSLLPAAAEEDSKKGKEGEEGRRTATGTAAHRRCTPLSPRSPPPDSAEPQKGALAPGRGLWVVG